MGSIRHGGDDAVCASTPTTKRPEQVGVGVRVRGKSPAEVTMPNSIALSTPQKLSRILIIR